jgi:hypothetical protein
MTLVDDSADEVTRKRTASTTTTERPPRGTLKKGNPSRDNLRDAAGEGVAKGVDISGHGVENRDGGAVKRPMKTTWGKEAPSLDIDIRNSLMLPG